MELVLIVAAFFALLVIGLIGLAQKEALSNAFPESVSDWDEIQARRHGEREPEEV